MFVAEAHSFQQQARLAVTLAWVAGYTNIITILTCGTVTSHVSGTASNLGRDVAESNWPHAAWSLYIMATFFAGAMISGMCTETGRRRHWESIYVLPIALHAALLFSLALGLEVWGGTLLGGGAPTWIMVGLAAGAMGLQNATITRISNGVVRTTHVTGVLTDLGTEAVHMFLWFWDRRQSAGKVGMKHAVRSMASHPTPRRLTLLACILGSFALGACLGTLVYDHASGEAMFPPVLFLVWIVYQDISRPIAEIAPADTESGGALAGLELPVSMALFHLRQDAKRKGKIHRLPNLMAWSESLSPATKVVVLDFGVQAALDDNAAAILRTVLQRMRTRGRRLILSGLSQEQCRLLRKSWGQDLHPEDVCPDLDLALAHGMVLLEEMEAEQAEEEA